MAVWAGALGDGRGMEDLPFKLLLTSIVLALVLPLGWGAYSAYDEATLNAYVSSRLDSLGEVARSLSSSPGGFRSFTLDLSGSATSGVDWVDIGGPVGSGKDQLVSFSVEGDRTRKALEGVRLSSEANGTLRLHEGLHRIDLESKSDWMGRIFVEVSMSRTEGA